MQAFSFLLSIISIALVALVSKVFLAVCEKNTIKNETETQNLMEVPRRREKLTSSCHYLFKLKFRGRMNMEYISTNQSAITVEQMIEILSQQDKKALIYILDDNDKQRPVYDIGKEENKIVICDF